MQRLEEKSFCPCWGSNPDCPARSQTLCCLSYCGRNSNLVSCAMDKCSLNIGANEIEVLFSNFDSLKEFILNAFDIECAHDLPEYTDMSKIRSITQ
jgi:hypothetical protein